jgi:hypothetical protein
MEKSKISIGAGIGLVVGVIIGSVTDNIGLCFGAGIGTVLYKKSK